MISELINDVLSRYPHSRDFEPFRGNALGGIVRRTIPEELAKTGVIGSQCIVKGSVGQGNWATVPWIAIMDMRLTTTTQNGIYIVYLFAENGAALYLTLNQGCTDIIKEKGHREALSYISQRAKSIRSLIHVPDGFQTAGNIIVGNQFYEQGCIMYKRYKHNAVPPDETIISDLTELYSAYDKYRIHLNNNGVDVFNMTSESNHGLLAEHIAIPKDIASALPHTGNTTSEPTSTPDGWMRVDFAKTQICERTMPVSCIIAGRKLSGCNWARLLVAITEMFISEKNPKLNTLYNTSVFTHRKARPYFVTEKIPGLHCAQLNNGYWININYNIPTLVDLIGLLCIHCGVSLDDIVIYYVRKGRILSTEKTTRELRQTSHEIDVTALGIDPSVQTIMDSELNYIVDLDEGKRGIREILSVHFLTLYGYSNIGILWSAAQNSLSMFLNDNAINSIDDFWRFLVSAFRNEFVFSSPHIWQIAPDYPQNSRGLIINLARQHGYVVTRGQIDDFFSRIKITSIYNSFVLDKGELLFYDNDKFILTEAIKPTDDRCLLISKTLNSLFAAEAVSYIILRDISPYWFTHLPELPNSLQWTPLLLQELLRIRSDIRYRIISPNLKGQALDTIGAAIVPSESEIETFADVVHRFYSEKYKLPVKLSAEELRLSLREAGMLEGNELIYNIHKALKDYRFAFSDENRTVMILER